MRISHLQETALWCDPIRHGRLRRTIVRLGQAKKVRKVFPVEAAGYRALSLPSVTGSSWVHYITSPGLFFSV